MNEEEKSLEEMAALLERAGNLDAAAAELLHVSTATVYNWLNLKTVMDGENMLLVIDLLMGGRYSRRTA